MTKANPYLETRASPQASVSRPLGEAIATPASETRSSGVFVKRPSFLLGAALVAIVACACVLALQSIFEKPEPAYKGKRLSEWVMDLNGEFTVEQATALNEIGTNAVPHLLKWFTYETPGWKAFCYGALNRLRSALHKPPIADRRQTLGEEATTALQCFILDSPEIAPECRRLAARKNLSPKVRWRVDHLLFVDSGYPPRFKHYQIQSLTNAPANSVK